MKPKDSILGFRVYEPLKSWWIVTQKNDNVIFLLFLQKIQNPQSMNKFIKHFFFYSITIILFSACSSSDNKTNKNKNTVIVYMLGNNTLSNYIDDNLNKMSSTWSDEFDGNCVAILDEPTKTGHQLSLVEVGTQSRKTIKIYSNNDALDPTNMKSLIEEAMNLYPAEKYTLILWSHGLGWLPNETYPTSVLRSTSNIQLRAFGESGTKQMELKDLADGIPNNAFETIIFDACLMGSIEVAYELRNKSNYMVASPAEVLAEGFPYHITIPLIMQNKTPQNIASSFVEYYRSKSNSLYQSATIGVVKMNELETLAQKTKAFYTRFNSAYALINRADEVQRFDTYYPHIFFDFKQMIDILTEYGFQEEADAVQTQLSKTIVYKDHKDKFLNIYDINTCSGISSYIPIQSTISNKLKTTYQTLSWYDASGSSFLFN